MKNCTCIKLKTVDQRLSAVQQPILASGDVGTVRVEYAIDSYWDGYALSGTFYTGKKPEDVYEQPLTDGACVIPWEVLHEDGILYIGLRGVDGAGLVKTAAPVRYRIEKGSPGGSATAVEPTPDVYQQLLAMANEAKDIAQRVRDDANSGAFDGEDGKNGTNGKDAYEYAKDGGYTGTEAEFAQKLAKALPVANVLDYGAKGDGSADDTAAFKAALAAERVLFVPGGTYKLTGGVTVYENCTLELAQDAVLNFTNTTGNCITLLRLANLKGNHATINVPYAFTGRVINCDTGDDEAHLDPNNLKDSNATAVPPFTKWSPQWKMSRYMTDVNICKPKSDGEHNSADGSCSGTAVYLHCNEADFVSFMWGVSMSGVRIAGAFDYGIRAYNIGAHVESWNHDMRIEAVVDACKVGVSLENCYYARLEVSVQARAAANGAVYATHGIELRDSRGVDMSGSRVWDWNGSNSLWASGNQYQHLALYGECRGLILDDFMYYENSTDIRDLIYTNKASNLEQLTILQEPVTRWFKSKDGEPVFSDGLGEKKLITEEQLNAHFGTALVKNFTDVLATATDENGAVLDGKGYTGGYLTGTGALYTGGDSKAYYVTTGFIPCAKGQTAYVEGMSYASYDGSCTLCMYDANKKFISTVSAANLVKGNYWYVTYQETAKGFSVMPTAVVGNENVAYIRFTVLKSQMGEHPMIAVDEEIKYTVEGVLADGIKVKGENVIGGTSGGGGSGGSASIDVTAQVGQTIIVKEVDASGKPTKWESADYQPRTHYTAEAEILPENVFTFDDGMAILGSFYLTVGDTYKVIWNGTEYECVAIDVAQVMEGTTGAALGNLADYGLEDTGEPFIIIASDAFGGAICTPIDVDNVTSAKIKIIGNVDVQIPGKYIPSDIRPFYVNIIEEENPGGTTYSTLVAQTDLKAALDANRHVMAKVTCSNGDICIGHLLYSAADAATVRFITGMKYLNMIYLTATDDGHYTVAVGTD